MQGASKRQANAEEMLAELKRVVESSMRAPDVPPPSLTASKSSSVGPAGWQSPIGPPIKASVGDSIGRPSGVQKLARPRSWRLTAGGLALAGAAMIGASYVLMSMNKPPSPPKSEPSAVATERLVRPQGEQTRQPSADSRSPMVDRPQAGALETRPDVSAAPANSSSLAAVGGAEVALPHPASLRAPSAASLGLETAPPVFTPAPPSPAPGASQTVRPDGAPIAAAPSTAPSTDSAPPAETPKPNATPAAQASNEPAPPSPPKIEPTRRPPEKRSLKKPARIAKGSAKPVARVERQPIAPARPKEAESPPQPAQDAGNPTPLAPAAPATIQQRFADGITQAFSYVTHLPGALVPHPPDSNAGAH